MDWNGHANGYYIHETSGEENPKIDENSFHTFSGQLKNNKVLNKCLPPKINIQKKINTNLVEWPKHRPPQEKVEKESTYVDLDTKALLAYTANQEATEKERKLIRGLPGHDREWRHGIKGFKGELKKDKYENIYPKYTKKQDYRNENTSNRRSWVYRIKIS